MAQVEKASFLQRLKMPHVFTLLTGVIFVCSLLTYVIPSGSYEREEKTFGALTRTVVVPGTYENIPKYISLRSISLGDGEEGTASPTSLVGFLSAIPRGMEQAADIIFFIFVLGGVFGILQRSGTITALIHALLQRFSNSGAALTIILMTAIAIGGSTLGMGEEFIPLVPIFLIVANNLGYDRVYGLALVLLAAETGFAAATTNPFTVQIAQGIAELPLGSGIQLRLVFFVCCLTLAVIHVLRYGNRIKKDPSQSLVADDEAPESIYETEDIALTRAHVVILFIGMVIFTFMLYAVQNLGWWLPEMAGGFLLIGYVAVVISKLSVAEASKAFVKGTEEMVVAALVVGFAKGIQVVLADAEVLDTLIFSAASLLKNFPGYVAAEGMLIFQTMLNFFIPSGSGQAAVTMPLMAPLADVLGLTRQTAVLAFTCGDGFSNTIVPTSGILMGMLALAHIPYQKWLRFMLPLFLQFTLLAAIFLFIAVAIDYR